ncbi:hypothetical protein [Rhodococcus opacus]|uniref:hypothetical protein n=1 Tax=Rhodococcus opacus TaxID=37919 RepID=UPI001F55C04B|nr:hypothetical protein [Rhodococcus opacus]UNN00742.1 hypothetical protein MOO23_34870 [Rhodococcus opacus]
MGIRPIDKARAARVTLGLLDDDRAQSNRALAEANADGSVHLLIGALAGGLAELLVATAGDENTRSTLQRVILDAQLADERPANE